MKVVTLEDPILIFLMETKPFVSEMNEIKEKLDQSQGLIVLSNGRSGGLALLWRRGVDVAV